MAQDTRMQQGHVYEIAHRAQKKAVQARRRRLKRRVKAVQSGPLDGKAVMDTQGWHGGTSATQRRGMHGEEKAAQYLQKQGLRVLARNIHCRTGEIDLVATDGQTLIFIEVRLRESRDYGGAAASVNPAKQRRLTRTARFFLPQFSARDFGGITPPCRFDVICIDGAQLHWIRHAFDAR